MKVVVGSASPIKFTAVQRVFPDAKIVTEDIRSGVPPQPIGKSQTKEGATNRAQGAHKKHPSGDLFIGIENGMIQEEGKWVDLAAIVILEKREGQEIKEHIVWSDSIDIPDDSEKGPNGEWSILKDPHSKITNGKRSRADFLSDALSKWKDQEDI